MVMDGSCSSQPVLGVFLMKKTNKRHDSVSAQRMRHMRIALGFDQAKQFAEWLGVEEDRWGNVERGYPLSMMLLKRLCQKYSGLSADWLLFGKTDGLSLKMAGLLL